MSFPWQTETLLVLCSLVIITAAVTRYALSAGMSKLLMFALAPYVLFSLWRFEIDNGYQIFDLATKLVAVFTATYLVSAWFYGERKIAGQYVIAAGMVIGLTGPGVISLINHIYVVAVHPEQGHEYADNRSVADALGHIPVENTLLVTNDLRYPADGYSRENRQFQLAGIFGHRNFAANLEYGGFRREDMILYLRLVKLFQTKTWPATQIGYLREKVGITHLLIHKNYAHADDIPLDLVYENKDYAGISVLGSAIALPGSAGFAAVWRRPSQHRAARGDRPQRLDAAVAHADVPVVEIDRRIAVAGNQLQLVADLEARRAVICSTPCSSDAFT